MKSPPYLQAGDCIALTCPAGYMPYEKAENCISVLQQWGYKVLVGKTIGSASKNYFSATDEDRLTELQTMLDAPDIKAILCGRGGYGVGRIIDKLDFTKFKKNPKWLIGFSDITVLHAHINRNCKVVTLHSPMAGAFNNNGYKNKYVQSIKLALTGQKANYSCKPHKYNQIGSAIAELIGGNLAIITHLIGTKSSYQTSGKILFIEDVGEQHYNIDRMLHQLKRSGKLDALAGLVIGGFTNMLDTDRPFGKTVYNLIYELVKEYNYPICFSFPVSHAKENVALKVGATYSLQVASSFVNLTEV